MTISFNSVSHIRGSGTPSEKKLLRNVTLDIASGSCTGIIGRTGSGKSALVQHLNGLLLPTMGSVWVEGIQVTAGNLKALRSRVGMVLQCPDRQLFEQSVYREIAFGLEQQGLDRSRIELRVREALALAGLGEELLESSPFRLSGAQKRRVAIAALLARRPEVVVLDEPLAGLDPRGRRELLDAVSRLQRELGFTLLLVSSSLEDVARVADRVVLMHEGGVELQGRTREVLGNVEALERVGIPLPPVTSFMMKLRGLIPELSGCILTPEEARDELKRVLARQRPEESASC